MTPEQNHPRQTGPGDVPGFAFSLDRSRHALFLDFDGTLTALQDDPEQVWLPEGGAHTLERLAKHLGGALAIVSGRDMRDLDRRVPGCLWRAGGHGSTTCAPGQRPSAYAPSAPDALYHAVYQTMAAVDGARLETKGPILTVHYRAAPEAGPALGERLEAIVAAYPGYSLQAGKMVFEAKPRGASKARAIARLMAMPPFAGRRPVMVGDDVTDEDGMREALALGGDAIKVGDGKTVASLRLKDPAQVWDWLEAEIA